MKIYKTDAFAKWLHKLKDNRAKAIIHIHIERMESGNTGKIESVGDGVYEKKINYGPGYRLYMCMQGNDWIILLHGGDKSSQQEDINHAIRLRKELR